MDLMTRENQRMIKERKPDTINTRKAEAPEQNRKDFKFLKAQYDNHQ